MRHLLIVLLAIAVAAPAHAQHLGARVQWQPSISDTDARIQQYVDIEILGRAAVPSLEILTNATGVALTVAPEDLATVGERKLTLISKGLTLKAIMVQLPEALQECHWDIDASGEEPVYSLHRNGNVEATAERQKAERRAERVEEYHTERRAARRSRLEATRQALRMSPSELARLEEADPLLARAVQEPTARAIMEAFLNLPDEHMDQFEETGRLEFRHEDAPAQIRSLVRLSFEQGRQLLTWVESWPAEEERPPGFEERDWRAYIEEVELKLARSPDARIAVSDEGVEPVGIMLLHEGSWGGIVIPPRYAWWEPSSAPPAFYGRFLLTQTGADWASALDILEKSRLEFEALIDARERDHNQCIAPSDPRLHCTISVPGEWVPLTALGFQQAVAEQTRMSVLADSFTDEVVVRAAEVRDAVPLWRLLCRASKRGVEWDLVGDCLVFHHRYWYRRAYEPVPAGRPWRNRIRATSQQAREQKANAP